jgi:hypothetical protein
MLQVILPPAASATVSAAAADNVAAVKNAAAAENPAGAENGEDVENPTASEIAAAQGEGGEDDESGKPALKYSKMHKMRTKARKGMLETGQVS